MLVELRRGLVGVALHGGFFQRAIETLDLAIRSGVGGLGQPVCRKAAAMASSVMPVSRRVWKARN